MKRIAIFVLGLLASCDAQTFYCGDIDHPSSCYCKEDFQPCNWLGECIQACPAVG